MSGTLQGLIVLNLFLFSIVTYLDWWGGYDGLNFFLLPFIYPAIILLPVNIIWTIVFMVKATDREAIQNVFWAFLAFLPIAVFFLPRFPR